MNECECECGCFAYVEDGYYLCSDCDHGWCWDLDNEYYMKYGEDDEERDDYY